MEVEIVRFFELLRGLIVIWESYLNEIIFYAIQMKTILTIIFLGHSNTLRKMVKG